MILKYVVNMNHIKMTLIKKIPVHQEKILFSLSLGTTTFEILHLKPGITIYPSNGQQEGNKSVFY